MKNRRRLRIGIVGLGFMGKKHLESYASLPQAVVVAVADSDLQRRQGEWANVGGNLPTSGRRFDLSGFARYATPEELIADRSVDVVDITLPTVLHARYAILALRAGKAVICEKPLARTVAEGIQMVAVARRARQPLCIAHCIRFWPEYAAAKELVDSGRYGRVVQAAFTRLGPVPGWSRYISDGQLSGGAALDLHIHDADFVQHLLGLPDVVQSVAAGDPRWPNHICTNYLFRRRPNVCVTAEGGWLHAPHFRFQMSFRIQLAQATVTFGWGADQGLVVERMDGRRLKPRLKPGDGYFQELAYFLECIRAGRHPTVVTPESSLRTLRLIAAEIRSAATGRPVPVPR